jgi:hypothetical protein
MNKPAKKILLAVRPSDLPTVSLALGEGFDIVLTHRLEEAKARLKGDIGLIACGVHFDGGMLFELLNATRSHPITQSTPFYVLFKEEKDYSRPMVDGIRSASKLLGATDFIDLLKMEQELGAEGARQALRIGIRGILKQSGRARG